MSEKEICKRLKNEPQGYYDWHLWAHNKNKKYKQVKCKKCGLWHKWKRRSL